MGLEILFQSGCSHPAALSPLLVCFSVQRSLSVLRASVAFLSLPLLSASVNAHSYIKFNILQNSLKVLNLPTAANSLSLRHDAYLPPPHTYRFGRSRTRHLPLPLHGPGPSLIPLPRSQFRSFTQLTHSPDSFHVSTPTPGAGTGSAFLLWGFYYEPKQADTLARKILHIWHTG